MERLTKEKAKALVLRTVRLFLDNNMFVYSGNATLFIITAAFPFIMLIIAIINLVPWYSPADVSDVLLQLLPDLGQVRELLESMMSNLRNQSGGLLASAAALTTLWSASGGVNAIRVGLNQFDDAEKEKGVHNILKRLVFTLMMVVLIPALLVFNMLGSSVLNVVNSILERIGIEGLAELEETLASVFHVSNLIVAGVGLLAVLMLYAYLPITRHTLKSRLPGAKIAAAGFRDSVPAACMYAALRNTKTDLYLEQGPLSLEYSPEAAKQFGQGFIVPGILTCADLPVLQKKAGGKVYYFGMLK